MLNVLRNFSGNFLIFAIKNHFPFGTLFHIVKCSIPPDWSSASTSAHTLFIYSGLRESVDGRPLLTNSTENVLRP